MNAKMSVEYHASTVTNMDLDNSKVGYRQLLGDGNKLRFSVYALRNSPFRAATVGLGLLCALLLAGVIGQSVHYRNVEQTHQSNLKDAGVERQALQKDLQMERNAKKKLETNIKDVQQSKTYLSSRIAVIQTNNNLLTEEKNKLTLSQSQLQATNAAFSKEIEQLKASKEQLQTNNNALTTAKDLLQKQYDLVLGHKTQVQANCDSVTKDRDNLQNKYNNMTRSKEQLQIIYNDLIKKVEHLQDSYNFTSNEKERIEKSHQNLTLSKETLQETNDLLTKATDELRASYTSLVQEKDELESSCKSAGVEKDLLKVKNYNLTAERDALQIQVERLKGLVPAKKCPTGWTVFQNSCYFTSVSKKSWSVGRSYCQGKGADLAIVKTDDDMVFINSLYSSDKEVWIGLTDGGIEGQWKWVDGTPLTTTFWGKDQPNSFDGRNQDCVEFWHRATKRGDWNDENCNIEQEFICQK